MADRSLNEGTCLLGHIGNHIAVGRSELRLYGTDSALILGNRWMKLVLADGSLEEYRFDRR